MVIPRLCALILAASGSLGAWAAEVATVARVEAPRWVLKQEVDFAAPGEAVKEQGESSYLLLRDVQRHLGEATEYRHIAFRLLTQEGVQSASTLSFEFDPAYEHLELHQLLVHRDGQPLNRLPQQEVKVFQRETNLEDQLYDGRLTASIILEDVRVGDVIEYAYSRHGENPIYAGHLLGSVNTEWTRPLHQSRERLLCPARRPQPQFQGHGTEVKARVQPSPGDLTEYRWDADDQPRRLTEDDVPSWVDTLGWVQFSDFQSWGEVAQWAAALFTPARSGTGAALPEELEKEAAALEQLPAGAPRIAAALRYVQDNFRYLGIEIGANSHQPYPVAKVCARRFGDCKDKANLLSALLRRLGFDADPALVSTDDRHTIAGWLPTPSAFNHAIVRVIWEGRAYWLDPTREHQGGTLEHIYLPAYGKALVVNAGTRDLAEIQPGGQEESTVEVLNTFRQTNDVEPPILHVRTTFRGVEADYLRDGRASRSSKDIERDYLNFYARHYPQVRARQPVRFVDDLERNELVCDEEYELPGAWEPETPKAGQVQLSLLAGTLAGRLTRPELRVRTMPFRVPFPSHVTEQFEVQLERPPNIKPEHLEIKDPAFHFIYHSEMTSGRLRLRYEYTAQASEVAAGRTAEYSANVKRAREEIDYLLWRPDPAAAKTAVRPAAAAAPSLGVDPSVILAVTAGFFTMIGVAVLMLWLHERKRRRRQLRVREPGPALHACAICHRTEVSHPDLEFRVAGDGRDYCVDHLRRAEASPAG